MTELCRVLALLGVWAAASGLQAGFKQSYAPIVGYDTVSGLQYGAAAFLEDPSRELQLQLIASEYGVYLLRLDLEQRLGGFWKLEASQSASDFFDAYFGEGAETRLSDRVRLDQRRYHGLFSVLAGAEAMQGGVFGEWRWRDPQGVDGDPARILFPAETTAVGGLLLRWDRRDQRWDPREGAYAEAKVWAHPDADPGTPAFAQARVDLRAFHSPLRALTLAARLGGGWTWGPATYPYRFTQGGNYVLRGNSDDRYRGGKEVSGSVEARFPIWAWFSGAAFIDAGEVADELRGRLHASAGAGLRLALPPDGLMKARLDYGKAADEDAVMIEFGQAF